MIIHMTLRQRRAQKSLERSAPGIIRQRRPPFSVARPVAASAPEHRGIKRIRQFLPQRGRPGNADRRLSERLFVSGHELRPRSVATKGTGMRQSQIAQLQRSPERDDLRVRSRNTWGHAVVILDPDTEQHSRQFVFPESNRASLGEPPELINRNAAELVQLLLRILRVTPGRDRRRRIEFCKTWRYRVQVPTI